ncbi:hypothetical protein PMIN04_012929 [Paraphaeosphaeria minitans]
MMTACPQGQATGEISFEIINMSHDAYSSCALALTLHNFGWIGASAADFESIYNCCLARFADAETNRGNLTGPDGSDNDNRNDSDGTSDNESRNEYDVAVEETRC